MPIRRDGESQAGKRPAGPPSGLRRLSLVLNPGQTIPTLSLAIAIGFGVLGLVWLLARPLALVFLALTLAESLRPIVRLLNRRVSRSLAVAAVYLVLALLVVLAGWFLVPIAIEQGRELLSRAPELMDRLQGWVQGIRQAAGVQGSLTVTSLIDRASQYLLTLPVTIGTAVFETLIVVFLSFYWLLESPRLWSFVQAMLPSARIRPTGEVLDRVSSAIGGYVRAAAIDGLIVGAIAATGLAIIGTDYPIALAVVAAIAELVPYAGPIFAGGLATVVGLLQSPWHGMLAALLFLAIQQIEGHLLTPAIMRSQTTVSATVVIIALLAGGSVGGVLGALTAVPLAAAVRTLITDVAAPAVRKATAHPD